MRTEQHLLTSCTPGTTRELQSLHFGPLDQGRKAVIQASLHADEPPGMLVAYHLRRELAALEAEHRLLGEIVLLPMANPLGLSQRLLGRTLGRFDLGSGENFNRRYQDLSTATFAKLRSEIDAGHPPSVASVRAALRQSCKELPADSELASLRKTLLLQSIDADLVLDLHCDSEAVMHLYTANPLWPKVEALARLLGAEVSLLATESGGEPFDESCSMVWPQLNRRWQEHSGSPGPWPDACIAVTVELRGETDVSHDLAEHDARAILAYLAHQGFIDARLAELPPLLREATPLEGSIPVISTRGGVLVHRQLLGQWVQKGQCIAEVIDPLSGDTIDLCSPVEGLLYAREISRLVHAGMSIAKVAGSEAVRSGQLLSA
jgi:predicted deacylase